MNTSSDKSQINILNRSSDKSSEEKGNIVEDLNQIVFSQKNNLKEEN